MKVDSDPAPSGRASLVIVSNRLPYTRPPEEGSPATAGTSPGGLIAALTPVMDSRPGAWVGWSGLVNGPSTPYRVGNVEYHPVSLSAGDIARHYEGLSNQTIWPLYHDVGVRFAFQDDWWESHLEVNERFALAVSECAAKGAVVWVHDYQLQLLPKLLRALRPDLTIGYFHHIPFPAPDVLAELSQAGDILQGLLGADLVGFQRPLDVDHFDRAVSRFLGMGSSGEVLTLDDNRQVWRGAFPISLDFSELSQRAQRAPILRRAQEIREELGRPDTVFLGVDRLDYTKGIPQRLRAFLRALESHRLDPRRHVFVQLASPSRETVSSYQDTREEVEGLVAQINSLFPNPLGGPVVYRSENLERDEMLAHYLAADVMVVTSLRDGMNLVAKEYVACRNDDSGVLVLSRETGAADELQPALLVNPLDIEGLADALVAAREHTPEQQRLAMASMRSWIRTHDVTAWATAFLDQLDSIQKARSSP